MTHNSQHLNRILMLATLVSLWLCPVSVYATPTTQVASICAGNISHAQQETGQLASPLNALQQHRQHLACETEETRESETEFGAQALASMPFLQSLNHSVISRIAAIDEQAKLSVLHSRVLPMLC